MRYFESLDSGFGGGRRIVQDPPSGVVAAHRGLLGLCLYQFLVGDLPEDYRWGRIDSEVLELAKVTLDYGEDFTGFVPALDMNGGFILQDLRSDDGLEWFISCTGPVVQARHYEGITGVGLEFLLRWNPRDQTIVSIELEMIATW
jgi:hypothetical protein